MFTESNNKTPFSKLRFDFDALVNPLGGGGGASRVEVDHLRFGMPVDPLLDETLRCAPPMPRHLVDRLHQLIDELPEDTAV
jgi:hypothetical protein